MSLQLPSLTTPLNAPYTIPLTQYVDSNLVNKQVDIENRILRLVEFSNLTNNMRDDAEMARKMVCLF